MGKKITTEEFIEKARVVHGDKFDYSEVEYKNSNTKVKISCKEHGAFNIVPYHHLAGVGCPPCSYYRGASERVLGEDEFIRRARNIHGDTYLYHNVTYVNSLKPVKIVCKAHGAFMQLPSNHLKGYGCSRCTNPNKMVDTESCKKKFYEVHGNRYDYSQVIYVKNSAKVNIICEDHGMFLQTPANHAHGQGCPRCAKGGIRYSLPTKFYILNADELTKVGITNNVSRSNSRLQNIRRESQRDFKTVYTYDFDTGYVAAELESEIIKWMSSRYTNTSLSFAGRTECFEDVDLKDLINYIDSLIERIK